MDEQKELILQTASRMFLQSGVRNVSIDEVCSELRISKKTFYVHFSQKEDLVEAVVSYDDNKRLDKYQKNLKSKNAIDSLIYIIKEIRKDADCTPLLLWNDVQKFYPKVFEKHTIEKMNNIRMGFEQNIIQGIKEGYYRDDLDVELVALFHAVQIRHSFGDMRQANTKYTKKRLLDFFIDLIIHLIANEKGLNYLKEHYLKDQIK
jgi:TetR/AcrR family transcriptional regulator, cholesterol catabolism regulator